MLRSTLTEDQVTSARSPLAHPTSFRVSDALAFEHAEGSLGTSSRHTAYRVAGASATYDPPAR